MQIHDLTNGKYSKILDSFMGIRLDEYVIDNVGSRIFFNRNFLFNRYYPGTMCQKLRSYLQEVPVFLVETSISEKSFCIPGTNLQIDVPADSYKEENLIDESLDGFFRRLMEEPMDNEEEEYGRKKKNGSTGFTITDLLGVYISTPDDVTPSRIFVWIDKIDKCALQNQENSQALLEQVILHEYAHAFLDVTMFGFYHTPRFKYSDYPYRYIEETCANAISLWCGFRQWSPIRQAFIEPFIKKQPKEYAAGWDLFDSHGVEHLGVFEFWMQAKVRLDRKTLEVLDEFWKHKEFCCLSIPTEFFNHDGIMLVESCGQETWAYKEISSGEELGLIRIANKPVIICSPKYNSIWSFDSNNLCMVRLDKPEGYKYGYINTEGNEQIKVIYDYIYSFENGLAVAKLGGYYGIINEQDEEVVPFELDYPDMRALRNGYATMKDINDKWGAIDAKGNVVIPCEYDSLVIFDEQGIASVKKGGEEFLIDTKGKRVEQK